MGKISGWIRFVKIAIGFSILLGSGYAAIWLLDTQDKFDGSHGIALLSLGAVVGLVVSYGDKVEFLKAFGAELKFNKLNRKAEDTLAKLEQSRIFLFRMALRSYSEGHKIRSIGTRGEGDQDVPALIELVDEIKSQDIYEELKHEIVRASYRLLQTQDMIAKTTADVYPDDEPVMAPFDPRKMLLYAEEMLCNPEYEVHYDGDSKKVLECLIRQTTELIEIYEEARKSPSE